MNLLKGVIFDLDGVIVHTDEMHYRAWKQIASRIGVPFDREKNNRLRGVARMDCMDIILEGTPPMPYAQKAALAEEKNALYRKQLETLGEKDVDEEVKLVLKTLRKRGVKLAIGSSSKNAGFILEQIRLRDAFDALSDGNDIKKSKPDPEVFLVAAERLQLAPATCAVVEDAWAGIDAAKAGGFYSVGMGDAAGYAKADKKILRFSEILELPLIGG